MLEKAATLLAHDFKGNIIFSRKQFTQDYNMAPNWEDTVNLLNEQFVTQTAYDALNRPVTIVHPDNSEVSYVYDKGGLLQKVLQGNTEHITNITYNAKGQRENIYYGNNTKTRYYYNPLNFRLTRILTTRNTGQHILQDLNYEFDAVGNITKITDDAQQTHYFANSVIAPVATFEYDALYRLTKATGRELTALTAPNENDFANNLSCPNNASNAMQNYVHNYEYDALGNMLSDAWKSYEYATENNYLLGNDNIVNQFTYDAHGNMLTMPHLSNMLWDYDDRLFSASNGTFASYYNYDIEGNRTRKVVVKDNIIETRYYVNGYEVYRKEGSINGDFERSTVNISDDEKVFVRIETETRQTPIVRYQYDNHLGSACLELAENGDIISYEEYHPFGTTSYRAGKGETEVSQKRYKYNGKERDEETGLYNYGMRYYAAWLCRFISVDPLQFEYPNVNPYCYCENNPVNLVDPTGMSPEDSKPGEIAFIDSFSGKYLGSHTNDKIEGFSVRSIASGDFNNLQNNDFADSRFFSIDKSSKEVTVNYDQIAGAIGSIIEKTDKMIDGNFQEIEKALFIVFDKEQSSIYAIEQDYSNNTGGTAEHSSTNIVGMNSHSIISNNKNLVIIAEMHTHPEGSITEFSENTKLIGSYQYRDAGVSPDDTTGAQKFLAPVYAIAKFPTHGTKENVYRVNPDGTGADSKERITNINSINNKSFNIVRDAFKNRHY